MIVVAGLVALSGCGPTSGEPGDDRASSTSAGGRAVIDNLPGRGIERFYRQHVTWAPCPSERFAGGSAGTVGGASGSPGDEGARRIIECGTIAAPLDYTRPDGRQVQLALIRARTPHTDPSTGSKTGRDGGRVGSVLVNPGGPGASGVEFVAEQTEQLAAGVGDRFDIVGFDPRGIGASTPAIECLTANERDRRRASHSRTDHTTAGIARQEQQARDFADKCAQRTGRDVLAHVGTADTVNDMDLLRQVLGDEKLTFLGYSYGTFLGARYASKHPERVRAMILDGAVNPAENTATMTINQYAGLQQAFSTYAADCATRRMTQCPLGTDPTPAVTTAAFQQIVRPLIDRPAQAGSAGQGTGAGRVLSYGDAIDGTIQALYSPSLWPYLTVGLRNLRDRGEGRTLMQLADAYNNRHSDGSYSNATDALTAITCLDTDPITTQAAAGALAQNVRTVAPFADDGRANPSPDGQAAAARDACSFWPTPPTTLPQPINPGPQLPPVVVVSTTGDPATPYANGLALAQQLRGTVLTVDGTQHTSSFTGTTCIDQPLRTYLETGQPPAPGLTCAVQ
ncbi:alpha/beta hydrolase [Tsukamurella ocularis]|uniref:alpha/beta hydrolase n=1 Tax=Tsukamurella ocularis TaxID=1970234 RepID=UPI0021689059|nr:alpha/beta hydrolase [Tsukamurella ocularis]MCS3779412.1 pimeloyl-ACP methyl ester carboxylesterase [Tsukamurella ocularis]MCS3790007.1 pimeloyl-ACP methyl ester carboxylesterase [Tsukamurella ocularis]